MKAFALVLKVLAGLILVLVIAIGIILATVDPNDYKAEITQAVKDSTGRELTVSNMSLSVFPQLSVDLEQASLSNAAGFSEAPFVAAEKIQIGAAILPLLSKELQVETLTLHGLSLNLEKNKEGKTNWDDLTQAENSQESNEKTKEDQEASSNPLEKLSSLNIGGIDIKNGQVSWKDQQNQQDIQLSDLKLNTEAITFGDFFNVELSANSVLSQPAINSTLKLQLDAKLEQNGSYDVKNLVVENTTSGEGIPIEKAITTVNLATFSIQENQLSIPEIGVSYDVSGGAEFPLEEATGNLTLSGINGDITSQAFNAENINLAATLKGDAISKSPVQINLKTDAKVDLNKQTAALNKLVIDAMGMKLAAKVNATQIIDNLQANANVNIAEGNLKDVLQKLNVALPEMANKTALNKISGTMQMVFKQTPQQLNISQLAINLDNSKLTGTAKVKNFTKPALAYDLTLDTINVNDYLPAKNSAKTSKDTPNESQNDAKIELPIQTLRDLSVNGSIKVGELTYDNLKPSNILVTAKAQNGNIQLSKIRADIFSTRVNAQAGLNVAGNTPKYNFKTDTQNLPVGDVLKAFTDDDTVSGIGRLNLNITTSGERVSEFKKGLNGAINADLKNGSIKGFNLAQTIRQAKAKLSGKTAKASTGEEKTDFSELNTNATIKNGVVTTKALTAKAPFMRLDGTGSVNLPKESLDLLIKTKIVDSDKGQGGEDLKELKGLTLPVKLSGNYLDPKISLDLESLVEQKVKEDIEKKKEKVVEDIKKKAEEKLLDLLPKGFKF